MHPPPNVCLQPVQGTHLRLGLLTFSMEAAVPLNLYVGYIHCDTCAASSLIELTVSPHHSVSMFLPVRVVVPAHADL